MVEAQPPSKGDEVTWVFLSAVFVVLCVVYIVAFEKLGGGREQAASMSREVLPYQVLFRDLPSEEQRMFRAMREGAIEALTRRATAEGWPAVETLATDGIPPFAPDPLDKSRLRWSLRHDGFLWQYVGTPSEAMNRSAFMISIQEPAPQTGEKPVPGVVDEEHQLLPDGRLLHVTYWMGRGAVPPGPIPDPALRSWRQIRVTTLFEEMEKKR